MLCHDVENHLPEYHENRLMAAQRGEVDAHLASCGVCRVFAEELRRLDAALSSVVEAPALSTDFEQRLYSRIQGVAPLTGPALAARKRQLQAEFDLGMAEIGRGRFILGVLINHLAWPILVSVVACLAWWITLRFSPHTVAGIDSNLLAALAGSTVFVAAGLAQAFPRQWAALHSW